MQTLDPRLMKIVMQTNLCLIGVNCVFLEWGVREDVSNERVPRD